MPIKSPLFARTSALCRSMNWKDWAGYYAVSSYEVIHDVEYFAIRNSAGLLDITPLFKYMVKGPDAAEFLSRIVVRDITKLKIGRVSYCCWCTHAGKVVDDGTIMRRGEHEFFATSADPNYAWFSRFQGGFDVHIEDVTEKVSGMALQGPVSRDVLRQITGDKILGLRYFRTMAARLEGFEFHISRTGYTGDLGFELWVDNDHALKLWDVIMETGKNFNIRPAGLDALDMTRVEAGLILKDVDYFNALHTLIPGRESSPFEITLGWTVDLDRPLFNGQNALKAEKMSGSDWTISGIEMDWPEIELLFDKVGLPPQVGGHAWRSSIPVYIDNSMQNQVGYATSGTWSPVLKKYIALATLQTKYAKIGHELQFEFTIEHKRHSVTATICKPQFFNPDRKRSLPQSES